MTVARVEATNRTRNAQMQKIQGYELLSESLILSFAAGELCFQRVQMLMEPCLRKHWRCCFHFTMTKIAYIRL